MKTISLCGRGACCPVLTINGKGRNQTFTIADDFDNEVTMTAEEAKTLMAGLFHELVPCGCKGCAWSAATIDSKKN